MAQDKMNVMLIGHIANTPKLASVNGAPVVVFQVHVPNGGPGKGFFQPVVWYNPPAVDMKKLRKHAQIGVVGRLIYSGEHGRSAILVSVDRVHELTVHHEVPVRA